MGQRYHVAVGAHTQCMHFQKYTPMDLFNIRNKVHEDEVSKSSDFDWEENNLVTFWATSKSESSQILTW